MTDARNAILTMQLSRRKSDGDEKNATKDYSVKVAEFIGRYGAPAAGVALAGPAVSLLPLGPFTPCFALIATSFASFRLKKNMVGGISTLVHAGGLDAVQGQVLSLLSFMSFSGIFDSLGAPVQAWIDQLVFGLEGIQPTLTGFCLSLVSQLMGLPGVCSQALQKSSASFLFLALRSFVVSHGLKWSFHKLSQKWRLFVKTMKKADYTGLLNYGTSENDSVADGQKMMQSEWGKLGGMALRIMSKHSDKKRDLETTTKQGLDEWEMIDEDNPEHLLSGSTQSTEVRNHAGVLFDEVTFLIDSCKGLSDTELDEAAAVLEGFQDDYGVVAEEDFVDWDLGA